MDSNCQNLPGRDASCNYFSTPSLNYCNRVSYLDNVLFSVACKKSCNLCDFPNNISTSTLPISTTYTTTLVCVDRQANCIYWANNCNLLANQNPHPCPKTCKICTSNSMTTSTTTIMTTTTMAKCVDTSAVCPYWVNYCTILAGFSYNPCPKTCNLC